ncbi:hypothetical protein CPB85DRAFT_1251412 [Mucidula mucida]|nr:hypothetical protein CPB85DRAFT_1251412 [Mucidula mucida]
MQPLCWMPLLLLSAVGAAPVGQLESMPVPVTNSAAHDPAAPRQLEELAKIMFPAAPQGASAPSIPSDPQSQSTSSNHRRAIPTLSERQIHDIRRAILDAAPSRRADTPSVPAMPSAPELPALPVTAPDAPAAPAAPATVPAPPAAPNAAPQGVSRRQGVPAAPAAPEAPAAPAGVPAMPTLPELPTTPQPPAAPAPPTAPNAPAAPNAPPAPPSVPSKRQLRAPDYNAAGPQPASHNHAAEAAAPEDVSTRGFGGTPQWAELMDDSDARPRSTTSHSWNDMGKSRAANYKGYRGTRWETREVERLARSARV